MSDARDAGSSAASPEQDGLLVRPIGFVRSPFTEPAEAPRQPRAAEGVRGTIELVQGLSLDDAVDDLTGWEFIWVVFWFHRADGWKPKVLPPRSERKRGVLSTRAPRRPNPIGLSVLRLIEVKGLTLTVSDLDLLDGTPVLDIKPYVPWTDAIPGARTGWLEPPDGALPGGDRPADPRPTWQVGFSPLAREQLAFLEENGVALTQRLSEALALGPQAHAYRRIKRDAHGLRIAVKAWYARFSVAGERIEVTRIESGMLPENRAQDGGELHRAFVGRFGEG